MNFEENVERTGGYPVHAAHRGGGGLFGPENTMYSYRKCVEHGARLLEIDVKLTKDEELVLIHDSSVERTTNGRGPVYSYLLQEIQELDAAENYPDLRGSGIRIPTLKEFLDEFVPNPNLLFLFDFKDCPAIHKTLTLIKGLGSVIEGRYMMCSAVEEANTLLCDICAPLHIPVTTDTTQSIKITISYNTGLWKYACARPDGKKQSVYVFMLLPPTIRFWSRGLVEAVKANGMRVLVCGEELSKEERLKECLDYGVDYIMTDRPDLLNNLLK